MQICDSALGVQGVGKQTTHVGARLPKSLGLHNWNAVDLCA